MFKYVTHDVADDNKLHSKTVPWLSPIHTQGNELCFIYTIKYDCTTFTSRVTVLNENTVRTEGIQITLYFKMSSISLVRQCCFVCTCMCNSVSLIYSLCVWGRGRGGGLVGVRICVRVYAKNEYVRFCFFSRNIPFPHLVIPVIHPGQDIINGLYGCVQTKCNCS